MVFWRIISWCSMWRIVSRMRSARCSSSSTASRAVRVAVSPLVDGRLLLPPGRHHGVALPLEGVEPRAHLPDPLHVAGRPDRRRRLLHRVPEMAVAIDQAHEDAALGGLVPLGGSQVLPGPGEKVLQRALHVPRHRGRLRVRRGHGRAPAGALAAPPAA